MSGLNLGKMFGIQIRIDWSWLLIFGLVSWSLGSSFAQLHPEWSAVTRWGIAVGGAILFFLSVLAHELAHSIMARARGVPVRNITLFLFGGVSNIQREPDTALGELLVAIVGPLTSFVLGAVFLMLGAGRLTLGQITSPAALMQQLTPLSTVFLWLGSVNIILGFFNMLPAFPAASSIWLPDTTPTLRASAGWSLAKSTRTFASATGSSLE